MSPGIGAAVDAGAIAEDDAGVADRRCSNRRSAGASFAIAVGIGTRVAADAAENSGILPVLLMVTVAVAVPPLAEPAMP